MDRFITISFPLPIILFIFSLIAFHQYNIEERTNFGQSVLDVQVNYATDAAVDEMIRKSEDLGMDYADIYRAKVNPEVALETFVTMMMKSYNMSLSKQNESQIRADSIKTFLVAGYDGFYLGEPTKFNDSGAIDIIFSNKIPYLHYEDTDDKLYGLNLAYEDCVEFDNGVLRRIRTPIPESKQRAIVSERITDTVTESLYKQKEEQLLESFYLPSDVTSVNPTNPIDRMTVLVYFEDIFRGYDLPLASFGIGGSRIQLQSHVGCYEWDYGTGITKYYSYLDKLPDGMELLETFETAEKAAQKGYYFDVSTFGK